MLPPLSLCFAGAEFKSRVRKLLKRVPRRWVGHVGLLCLCSHLMMRCLWWKLSERCNAQSQAVRGWIEGAADADFVLNQVTAACAITGLLKRALVVRRADRRIRRVYNQIEPKLIQSSPKQQSSKVAEEMAVASRESARELAATSPDQSLPYRSSSGHHQRTSANAFSLDSYLFSGDSAAAPGADDSISRRSSSDVLPSEGSGQARLLAASAGRRSPTFFGPGSSALRDAFSGEQVSERRYSGSSISSYPDEGGSDSISLPSKMSEIDASLDATTKQLLGASNQDEIDLRQVFGKDYIQELSADLPAGQGKVTVKTRDRFGNTALHLAAGRGDRLGCHFLVLNGADVAALNNDGRRCLLCPSS